MRFPAIVLTALAVSLPSIGSASEPQAVALKAITELFVYHDLKAFGVFVTEDAVQGDSSPGSAVSKLKKQQPKQLATVELVQILFFRKADIDNLEAAYPDDLWPPVRKHIGQQQGVLVRLALTGEVAERVRATGKDPRNMVSLGADQRKTLLEFANECHDSFERSTRGGFYSEAQKSRKQQPYTRRVSPPQKCLHRTGPRG